MDKKTKCDLCDAKAIITEVVVRNGEKIEQKLCESCAAEAGIAIQSHAPVAEVLTKFVVAQGMCRTQATGQTPCPTCGLLFAQFRKEHHLGCPDCYAAFEAELGPLIERAHEGGTHHVGKAPKSRSGSGERLRRATALRKQLTLAIETERFEKAAVIRDQIRKLEEGDEPTPSSPSESHRADSGIREA